MRRVFKYQLLTVTEQSVSIPGLVQALHIDVQSGTVCMWCLVDDAKPTQAYTVITHGTGHNADDTTDAQYVGSYMLLNGQFVGHVFIKAKEA